MCGGRQQGRPVAAVDPTGRVQRPGGSWARKNQASPPGGKWWVFCYKEHAFCDAVTELPIAVAVTTGSQGDSLMLPRWLNRFRRTLTGSAPWFALVTGATMPARIMPCCRSWALRPCATQAGFEAWQVALRRLYWRWRADLFGRNAPRLCPYRCGYGLLCLSVVRRLLG